MIKFSKNDENRSFIAIKPQKTNEIMKIKKWLISTYPGIKPFTLDDSDEILIELFSAEELKKKNLIYGFSLNELRERVNEISSSIINHFTVDFDEQNNRYYG